MFGISGFELLIIAAVGLIVFGPDELPKIGRAIGKGLRMFNDARQEVETIVKEEILRPEDMEMVRDPLGLKKTKDSLSKTLMDMSDPKAPPKGAGARVSTDDAPPKPVVTPAESIWAAAAVDEAEGEEE